MTTLRLNTIVLILVAAAAPVLAAQKNPDPAATAAPTAVTPPAPSASVTPAGETDDTAALIAKANAAAAANAKAEAVPAAPVVKNEPSPEARKRAREYGFHAEIYDGKTMFCRDDATLGTRIPSKRCMNSVDFEDYGRMLQIAREMMRDKNSCQGGAATKTTGLGGVCGGLE